MNVCDYLIDCSYTIENVEVRTVEFPYAALGPIFEQTADLPDGTTVEFKIRDEERGYPIKEKAEPIITDNPAVFTYGNVHALRRCGHV